jgi:Transglutaminase-like superfamily
MNGIASVRAGWWTLLAIERVRRQLSRGGGLDSVHLSPPPKLPPEAEKGVHAVLRYRRNTCLVRAAVRQQWFASQGSHRDIVIGVTAPKNDFQAHAWLDGDPPCHSEGFEELLRRPSLH